MRIPEPRLHPAFAEMDADLQTHHLLHHHQLIPGPDQDRAGLHREAHTLAAAGDRGRVVRVHTHTREEARGA